jgi:hypothetical protein
MRQDQYEKLMKLEEKLMECFLTEADPDAWPGKDIPIATMDQQTRGDRYWCKKNAAASGVLIHRVSGMIGNTQGHGTTPTPGEGEEADAQSQLDQEIASAEKEAAKLIAGVQKKASKAAFDKRVHGTAPR